MANQDLESSPGTVHVTLVDVENGKPFAEADLPPSHLPESFDRETRLQLGEQELQVISADPSTRAEIVARGSVVITLSRLQTIDPKKVGFSLPTICEHLPPLVPLRGEGAMLEFRLDDWRQIEFVTDTLGVEVDAEIADVQALYAECEGRGGFHRLHVRSRLAEPLTGMGFTLVGLQKRFGGEWGSRVKTDDLEGHGALIDGGVWFRLPGGLVGYAVEAAGRVVTLALTVPRGPLDCMRGRPPVLDLGADRVALSTLARDHGLLLVDWCAAQLVPLE